MSNTTPTNYTHQVSFHEDGPHLQDIFVVSSTMFTTRKKNAVDAQTGILIGRDIDIPGARRKLQSKRERENPTLITLPTTTSPIFA